MIWTSPFLLLALPLLPLLWWLLRVTPPAPRTQRFPAIRLLENLRAPETTAARTPPWLLALRMVAAGLVILGLAGPVFDAASRLPGQGPLLLAMDDGWAAAADWTGRIAAAGAVLDQAGRDGRPVRLLLTAPTEANQPPAVTPALPVAALRTRLAALRPKSWPPDRAAAALAVRDVRADSVMYIADGLAAAGDEAFGVALAAVGPVRELRPNPVAARVARPPRAEADRLVAHADLLPQPTPTPLAVLAQTGDGRTLARVEVTVPAGATSAEAAIPLPPELRNTLTRLVLEGPSSAASVVLLDERWRRRPVGLVSADAGADTPLIGPLFYVRRALALTSELREGSVDQLLARDISVLVLADVPLDAETARKVGAWVDKGGLLLRFAGPRMADAAGGGAEGAAGTPAPPDPLLPVRLLVGDRQLGGALSWSQPAPLARLEAGSPFAGLPVPGEVLVNRQVLAEPSTQLASRTWASLADGTPLVTAAAHGTGRVVLFHVTANADWSNLPLSGLFVDMLRRLVDLSVGVAGAAPDAVLAPAETLDGFGALSPPPPAATGLDAADLATPVVSPRHPAGLYGPESGRRALNMGAALPGLAIAPPIPGAELATLGRQPRERAIGPSLIAAALALLALDLLISLVLRGLLRRTAVTAVVLALAAPGAHAADAPALQTRLAFVVTDDATVDGISRAGLAGLSAYVNRRTAAVLGDPAAVVPGRDDLSFFPLLYWPITAAATRDPAAVVALNDYTSHGGIILIDTRNSGSGEGFASGTDAALRRVTQGLQVPALAPLTGDHVLARSFYLLQEFPGRFEGGAIYVGRDQDRSNDSVTPVIIGGSDWAAGWAVDATGRNPYATIPGGARQRTLAYRFGVNLVMYALTGNYKGDQVHVPAILERLGQ